MFLDRPVISLRNTALYGYAVHSWLINVSVKPCLWLIENVRTLIGPLSVLWNDMTRINRQELLKKVCSTLYYCGRWHGGWEELERAFSWSYARNENDDDYSPRNSTLIKAISWMPKCKLQSERGWKETLDDFRCWNFILQWYPESKGHVMLTKFIGYTKVICKIHGYGEWLTEPDR